MVYSCLTAFCGIKERFRMIHVAMFYFLGFYSKAVVLGSFAKVFCYCTSSNTTVHSS